MKSNVFGVDFFILICGISLIYFISCKKFEEANSSDQTTIIEKFLLLPADATPEVRRVAANLEFQNSKADLIKNLVHTEGYAVWDKSRAKIVRRPGTGNAISIADTILYIPLLQTGSNQVRSFLYAKLNDSITIQLIRGRDYETFGFDSSKAENAHNLVNQLIILNYEIFGYKNFKINDPRLFKDTSQIRLKNTEVTFEPETGNNALIISGTIWVLHYGCGGAITPCTSTYCDWCPACSYWTREFVTYFVDDDDMDPGGGGTPGGGGSGGGGAGDPDCTLIIDGHLPPGCDNGDQDPIGIIGGGNGPAPYSPYEAESVVLDTSITNHFPCITGIMDSLSAYLNANANAQVALHAVFNIDKKIHSKLVVDWTLGEHDADGYTVPNITLGDNENFYSTIHLNPWVLQHSTEEYIAETILHEIFHAYINYKTAQYLNNVIDSFEYKNLFPIYWPIRGANNSITIPGVNSSHNVMASNLINIMAAPLQYVNVNHAITTQLRDSIHRALAWGGLQNTIPWLHRVDTFDIKAINLIARDTSLHPPFVTGTGSPIYTVDHSSFHLKTTCP